jgi:hypothetical protein
MADIYTITGLSDSVLSSLIPYAQAQADAQLGFLEEETRTKEIYMWDKTDIIKLADRPVTSLESIKYKANAAATEETFDTDEYRGILDEGMIVFDVPIPEDYLVTVEYKIGWNQTTVTSLVKVWLCVLVVSHYYSLYPEISLQSQTIVSKKIGDVTLKYANVDPKVNMTLPQWAEHLGILVKHGGTLPEYY